MHTLSSVSNHTYPCVGESAPGGQVDKQRKGAPSRDPQSLACWTPPQVLRWALVINHWCFLSGKILPSVTHSFRQGLRWWVIVQRLWDQGELPHVQHWSHAQVEICHGVVGADLRLNKVFESDMCTHTLSESRSACFCVFLHLITYTKSTYTWTVSTCVCSCLCVCQFRNVPFQKDTQNARRKLFLPSSCGNQKQMSYCLEELFKHASWKIYDIV